MPLVLIAAIVLAILTALFAIQNATVITVSYLVWRFEASLALVLILTLGIGILIGYLATLPSSWRKSSQLRRTQRRQAELEDRVGPGGEDEAREARGSTVRNDDIDRGWRDRLDRKQDHEDRRPDGHPGQHHRRYRRLMARLLARRNARSGTGRRNHGLDCGGRGCGDPAGDPEGVEHLQVERNRRPS
jgi:putative membrane protein